VNRLPAIVPVEIADRLPFVTVTVGAERLRLRFDSRAYGTGVGLTPEELSRVQVDYSGASRNMDALGNISVSRKFIVPSVMIGNLKLSHVPGNELVFSANNIPAGNTGHVGMTSLRSFLLVVDFRAKQIEIRRSGDYPRICGTQEANLILDPVGLVSVFYTSYGKIRLLWDTAAQTNVLKPFVLGIEPGGFTVGDPRTLSGSIYESELTETEFRLVDVQIPGVDGILGYDYFADHIVCLDLSAGRLRSAPKAAAGR
jgi:hypothetical protein